MLELNLPYLNIAVDAAAGWMYSEWLRQPSEKEHLEGVARLLDALQRYEIRYWIKDSTLLTGMPAPNLKRELQLLLPGIVNSSLQRIACLITLDFDYMALLIHFMQEENIAVTTPIDARQFRNYKAAADWIADIKA